MFHFSHHRHISTSKSQDMANEYQRLKPRDKATSKTSTVSIGPYDKKRYLPEEGTFRHYQTCLVNRSLRPFTELVSVFARPWFIVSISQARPVWHDCWTYGVAPELLESSTAPRRLPCPKKLKYNQLLALNGTCVHMNHERKLMTGKEQHELQTRK